jgi:hypothetical protein
LADKAHTVQSGECMTSIAAMYGFHWQTLWNLPENSDLKNKRKNPNVLMPGDTVMVPDLRMKQLDAATDAKHIYERLGIPSKFRMRLLSDGDPRTGVSFTCAIDGKLLQGKTDSDGVLTFPIPPKARTGHLVILGEEVEEYNLTFGELNPLDDITGVQQRLSNLGYACHVTGENDEQTRDAVSSFRAENDLAESEEIDDDLRSALLKVHGS